MSARLAERRHQEVRRSVDHLWLIREIGSAVDHAEQLDHALDTVEFADLLLEHAEAVEDHELSRLLRGRDVEVFADLADEVVLTILATRALAGEVDEVAGPHRV